jgi:hypothetical protein
MRIAALKKPQDHDTTLPGSAALGTLLALALVAALPSPSALAQGAVPCTAIADDAERLECYDRALRAAPAAAPPARTEPPAAAPAAPPAAQAAPPAAAPSAAAPTETSGRQAREVRSSTAPSAPPAPLASAAPAAGASDPQNGIVPIIIVGTRALPGRETTFLLADGTSWVQTDSQRITGLPEPPFDAELKPGAVGSYFLVPKERGRAIRVRPVR